MTDTNNPNMVFQTTDTTELATALLQFKSKTSAYDELSPIFPTSTSSSSAIQHYENPHVNSSSSNCLSTNPLTYTTVRLDQRLAKDDHKKKPSPMMSRPLLVNASNTIVSVAVPRSRLNSRQSQPYKLPPIQTCKPESRSTDSAKVDQNMLAIASSGASLVENCSSANSIRRGKIDAELSFKHQNDGNKGEATHKNDTSSESNKVKSIHAKNTKIEDALLSQPQRGRKRDNLNEIERQELTRTRNREHAKSTRIRKKLRYQELLEIEKKVMDYQAIEHLNEKRRHCVVNFLNLREKMVKCVSQITDHSSIELNNINCNNEVTANEMLYKSFQGQLENMISDLNDCRFECESFNNNNNTSGFAAMKEFDEIFSNRVANCFGSNAVERLSFNGNSMKEHTIALTKDGTAMIKCEVCSSNDTSIVLLAVLWFQFKFVDKSDILQEVYCTVTKDSFDHIERDALKAQVSHPSVISLDPSENK